VLAELDFEHVLLAHGAPLIGDGRAYDRFEAGGKFGKIVLVAN
jgi:hypothetical protein